MALRPDVSDSHGMAKLVVLFTKKLEFGKALSVRAIKDIAEFNKGEISSPSFNIENLDTYCPEI